MAAVQDAITVCNILAGKNLTPTQLVSIVDKFNESYGGLYRNPYDPESEPDEYNAWPSNEDKATFFLQKMREEARSRLYKRGLAIGQANADAAVKAEAQAAADEL